MTGDLLELLAEQEAEAVAAAAAAALAAVPAPRTPWCRCSDHRTDGFTKTAAGEWVHAGCGLATAAYAASLAARQQAAQDPPGVWPYYAVSDTHGTLCGLPLPPHRVAALTTAGWTVAPWPG